MADKVFTEAAETSDEALEPLADQEVEEHYLRRLEEAVEFVPPIYWEPAAENHRFVWGGEDSQWEGDSAKERRDAGKAVLIENQISRVINIISGREMTSRVRPEYVGTDDTDQEWLAICRRHLKHVRAVGDHEQSESEGFRNCMIENISWLGWRQDRMRGPVETGMTVVEPIEHWEMLWDPAARGKNLLDRMWDARGYWVSYEDFLGMFDEDEREKAEEALSQGSRFWVDSVQGGASRNWPFATVIQTGRYLSPQRREVFLVHYVWKEATEHYYARVSAPGEPPAYHVFETEEEMQDASEELGRPIDFTPVPRWKYREAYFAGSTMMLERELPYREFPRQALTAIPYRQPERVRYYGPVDMTKDPQRMKNAVASMLVTAIAMTSKGNYLVEEGALVDPGSASKQLPKSGQLIRVQKEQLDRIKELPAARLPDGLLQLYEYVDRAFYAAIGINPGALGDLGSDLRRISGNVVQSVKEAATLSLATIFDSLRLYRKIAGRLNLDFMRAHLNPTHLERIVGKKLSYRVVTDPMTGEVVQEIPLIPPKEEWESMSLFDIEVDESESTADEQLKAFEVLIQTGLLPQEVAAGRAPSEIVPAIAGRFLPAEDAQMWREHAAKIDKMMFSRPPQPPPEE